MDKETLSNYGWIVICVLVLAVMIALAGPFGGFIADAVKSTTQGLFDVNQGAMDAAGITIEDNTFAGSTNENAPVIVAGATFSDGTFLTLEELKNQYNVTDTTIGASAFMVCSSLKSITIPNSVTNIGDSAFLLCSSLESIIFPERLTTIGDSAFHTCTSLTSIDLSRCTNLTAIGDGVFAQCSSLTSVEFPDSLRSIGENAFQGCPLKSITFNGTTAQWNAVTLEEYWNAYCQEITVTCTNGTITIPAWSN